MSAVGRDRVLTTEEMALAVERAPHEEHPRTYLCAYFERKSKEEKLSSPKSAVAISSFVLLFSIGEVMIRSNRGDLLARISEVWENFYDGLILFGLLTISLYAHFYIRDRDKIKEIKWLLASDPLANNLDYISQKISQWEKENPILELDERFLSDFD